MSDKKSGLYGWQEAIQKLHVKQTMTTTNQTDSSATNTKAKTCCLCLGDKVNEVGSACPLCGGTGNQPPRHQRDRRVLQAAITACALKECPACQLAIEPSTCGSQHCPMRDEPTTPAPQAATPLPEQGERALFEKEANAARFFPREIDFSRTKSPSGRDQYANSHLQSRWEGWQARATLTLQAAPEAPPPGDSSNPVYWYAVLAKCARLLDLPADEPIPSGVLRAIEKLTDTPSTEATRQCLDKAKRGQSSVAAPESPAGKQDEMPGMWEPADVSGGETDMPTAPQAATLPRVSETLLKGAHAEFSEAMPPLSLTDLGHRHVCNALRAAIKHYIQHASPAATTASASGEVDAYNYACELMEQLQEQRAKRGVEIGTQGSLCDGIAWLYAKLEGLEGCAPAPSREAAPQIKTWQERLLTNGNMGNETKFMEAEIADLRAALARQGKP